MTENETKYEGVIYMARNNNTSKIYIGRTVDFKKRKREHLRRAFVPNSPEYNTYFHRSIRTHGVDSFCFEILCTVTAQNKQTLNDGLNFMEQLYIEEYNTFADGYNCTIGGCGVVGYEFTEEHKRKIGDANRGRKMPDHVKQKLSIVNKGRKHTQEHRDKIRASSKGRKATPETCARIGNAHRGKKMPLHLMELLRERNSGANSARAKRVIQFSKNGELIQWFSHIKQASDQTGIDASSISACCKQKIKSAGSFVWRYTDKDKVFFQNIIDVKLIWDEYNIDPQTFLIKRTNPTKGKGRGEQQKINIRNGIKNRRQYNGVNNPSAKQIVQLDMDGVFIAEWECIRDAERAHNFNSPCGISTACKGKRPSAMGFKWMYKEDWDALNS